MLPRRQRRPDSPRDRIPTATQLATKTALALIDLQHPDDLAGVQRPGLSQELLDRRLLTPTPKAPETSGQFGFIASARGPAQSGE